MKKIYMRSSLNPLDCISQARSVSRNVVNGNCGNMIFAHSVARTLLCDDTQIDTTRTRSIFSEEKIDQINSEYDCFVIPLANAFRPDFRHELRIITKAVKQLKIPCIVIGIGVQARLDGSVNKEESFDKDAKKFMKAILEKSALVGIRGEVTADYLKRLGFQEERDFTVIGCPSMYLHGEKLPLKPVKELTPKSKVSVNRKVNLPGHLQDFIYESSLLFEDAMYVAQGIDDLKLLYTGQPISREKFPNMHPTYPATKDHPIYAKGREIGFVNVPSWMEFLSQRDFSFGSKIHGNITAVISGTPAFVFPSDSRIMELARYHNIQHLPADQITEDTNIFDIYEKADFTSIHRGHKERFYHYLDFLEQNGLEHIFGKERVNRRTKFDEIIDSHNYPGGILPYTTVSKKEQLERRVCYASDQAKIWMKDIRHTK